MPVHSKFKFCYLKLSRFFFSEYFHSVIDWVCRSGAFRYGNQLYLGKQNRMIPLYFGVNLVVYFILKQKGSDTALLHLYHRSNHNITSSSLKMAWKHRNLCKGLHDYPTPVLAVAWKGISTCLFAFTRK